MGGVEARHGQFETHRCPAKPERFSIRRYSHSSILPRGWVLAQRECDPEYWVDYLDTITFSEQECVRFCPWCGEKLSGVDDS